MTSSTSSDAGAAGPDPGALDALVADWRRCRGPVLVVTGAGISAASGLKTFRGAEPDAIWNRHTVALATAARFHADPVGQLHWYLERFSAVDGARPNPAHRSLVELEAMADGRFHLVTQNIDTLHERAGSRRLIKVHGTADRLRCGSTGCPLGAPDGSLPRSDVDVEPFLAEPGPETLPRCPRCASPLRAHVLFFDEFYGEHRDYRFDEVERWIAEAELMLFVGTSFAVGVTHLALTDGGRRRVPMWTIDPAGNRAAAPVEAVAAPAEVALPRLVERLRGG